MEHSKTFGLEKYWKETSAGVTEARAFDEDGNPVIEIEVRKEGSVYALALRNPRSGVFIHVENGPQSKSLAKRMVEQEFELKSWEQGGTVSADAR